MTVPKMAKKTGGMAPKRKMKGGAKDENGNEIPDTPTDAAGAGSGESGQAEAQAAEATAGETKDDIKVGEQLYTVTVNGAKVCVEPAAAPAPAAADQKDGGPDGSFGGKKGKKRTQKKKGKKPRKSAKKAKK